MFLKMSAEEIPLGKAFGNRLLNLIGSKAELPQDVAPCDPLDPLISPGNLSAFSDRPPSGSSSEDLARDSE